MAAHYNMEYVEVSAKDNIGVREVVEGLTRKVYEVVTEMEKRGIPFY